MSYNKAGHDEYDLIRRSAEDGIAGLDPLMAEAQHIAASILHGERAQRRSGVGEKFWQFREYQDGDRPQDIDWRQSAKGSRVFIRQKEWQNAQSHFFWCSQAPGMEYASRPDLPSKQRAARVLSLALGILFAHGGEQIAPFGSSRGVRGEAGVRNLGQSLLSAGPHPQALPDVSTHIPHHAFLCLAGDFLEPPDKIAPVLESLSLRSGNGLMIQILDPAELDLPFEGNAVFETPDDRRIHIQHVPSVRAAYSARINAHITAIENLCRRADWRYVLHRTDEREEKTLELLWRMLSRHAERVGGQ